MILNILIQFVLRVFSAIFSIFPEVSILSLPFGEQIRDNLILAVSYWNAFSGTFPYALVAWHVFLWVILPFEALMLLGRFFLGHRMPVNSN